MTTIITKGGEEKEVFETGAVRGSDENKPILDWRQPTRVPWSSKTTVFDNGKTLTRESFIYNDVGFDIERGDIIVGKVPYKEQDQSMIPDIMINRLGGLFWRGAQKYSRDNWKKGMNLARTFSSMFRHMVYWWAGDTGEDHLAAVIWNATVLMWTENEIAEGRLPESLADLGPMKGFKRDG